MTLSKTSSQSEYDALRLIVETLSGSAAPDTGIAILLEMAIHVTSARQGGLAIFRGLDLVVSHPETMSVPTGGVLQKVSQSLQVPFETGAVPLPGLVESGGWLAAPLYVDDTLTALLWLAYTSAPALRFEQRQTVEALINGLVIMVRGVLASALKDRLTRNQSEFIHMVSHDLRSPLTTIKGFAGMLESGMVGELNELQAQYVGKILSGVEQMTAQVDKIQDAGRLDPETGFYEIERIPCDVVEMAAFIVQNHLVPAEKHALSIETHFETDVPLINVDAGMLERAITNLVDNAIKYTPNGGHIAVGVRRQPEQVLLSVTDDGLGISEENQRVLFERHVRLARKEHKRIKGTGLGLFIVRSVARRHGGDAWVESVEGKGSTFYFSIPLAGDNLLLEDQLDSC